MYRERLMRKIYCQNFIGVLYIIDNKSNNLERLMLNVQKLIEKCVFFGLKLSKINSSKNYLTYCKLINKRENAF